MVQQQQPRQSQEEELQRPLYSDSSPQLTPSPTVRTLEGVAVEDRKLEQGQRERQDVRTLEQDSCAVPSVVHTASNKKMELTVLLVLHNTMLLRRYHCANRNRQHATDKTHCNWIRRVSKLVVLTDMMAAAAIADRRKEPDRQQRDRTWQTDRRQRDTSRSTSFAGTAAAAVEDRLAAADMVAGTAVEHSRRDWSTKQPMWS